jgi:hypothetical protein
MGIMEELLRKNNYGQKKVLHEINTATVGNFEDTIYFFFPKVVI